MILIDSVGFLEGEFFDLFDQIVLRIDLFIDIGDDDFKGNFQQFHQLSSPR